MVGEEVKVLPSVRNAKTYSRSSSWTERSPTKFESRSTIKNKSRVALPPLQPLSIKKTTFNDWPMPGSDDLGVWLNSPMPVAKVDSPMPIAKGLISPRDWLAAEPVQRGVELPREKQAFFNNECSKIVEYMFLGGDAVARNRDVLLHNGVTHVLNSAGFDCGNYFNDEFVYKTLWLQDSAAEDITSVLYDVFDYIEDVRVQGGKVFIHCSHGVSRSASLVIGYLMWKEEKSFEDAFQHVKSIRRVANPNMGFVCQLLQYQKRLLAVPPTPTSVVRMYWMAPHSPHDPLHLVPKRLDEPGLEGLDSRLAFVIHVPLVIYVWIGKHCSSVLADNAKAAAFQVIRYEKALGPAIIIKESEEPSEFWRALGIETPRIGYSTVGRRLVQSYNIGFEIFNKAVSGVVAPPATSRPLRRTFVTGKMKDLVPSVTLSSITPKVSHDQEMPDAYEKEESSSCSVEPLSPSSPLYDSQDVSPYVTVHPCTMEYSGLERSVSFDDLMLLKPSFASLDSYPRSASLRNSDISYLSAQSPPSGLETKYSSIGSLEDTMSISQYQVQPPG